MSEKTEKLEEKIDDYQEEYSKTKYNKATNKHLGILRFKIAKAKRELEEASRRAKGKGYFIKKVGDGTVALVGFPSAGKSSLINVLTNAKSKTAQYAFTTTTLIPAIMLFRDAHIQVFDLPGIIENAHLGAGGGTTVLAAARSADLVLFVVSAESAGNLETMLNEFRALNIHINASKPHVVVKRDVTFQGLKLEVNRSGMPEKTVQTILRGLGIYNAAIQIWDRLEEEEFIAIVSNRSLYMRAIVALNKIDLSKNYQKIANELAERHSVEVIPISATMDRNIDQLRNAIYRNLGLMRVYLKPRGREEKNPITVRKGLTIAEVAQILHTKIANELKCAYVEGSSVKFKNQRVGASHIVEDGDIVTFIT